MSLDEYRFPDCWKASSVAPVFQDVEERYTTKNYHLVSLLCDDSKIFDKIVNNNLVDHLEECSLFTDLQYGFRSSLLTADLLIVASDSCIW